MSEATVDRRSGLHNVIDVVVAPSTAFARLRIVPTWGWAFLAAALLAVAGALLFEPALLHVLDKVLPAQMAAQDAKSVPNWAQRSPDEQAKLIATQVSFSKTFAQFQWLIAPIALLLGGLIQALVMTLANAIGHGDGSFKKYFALSLTVAVVGSGLASLALGLIALLRGPGGFDDVAGLTGAVPSLALLAPGAHGALHGFLTALNVFTLWATALLALGMTIVGRLPRPVAWSAAVLMVLLTAAFAAFGAARQG
jgi:Yip1 domain